MHKSFPGVALLELRVLVCTGVRLCVCVCVCACVCGQMFEIMLQAMEAYQKHPTILMSIVDVIRDCVARDRKRDWVRFATAQLPHKLNNPALALHNVKPGHNIDTQVTDLLCMFQR